MARSERYVQSKEQVEQLVKAEKRKVERRATRRESISRALARIKKAQLIDVLLQLIDDHEEVVIWLEGKLEVDKKTADEALDVELDIVKAKQVPQHLINSNFPYDHVAYARIAKGLQRWCATVTCSSPWS